MVWTRGDLAIYEGGIACADLTPGNVYVVNSAGVVHDATYLQIITDNREVHDLLAVHFRKQEN